MTKPFTSHATWDHATGTGTILVEKKEEGNDGTTSKPGWVVIRGMPKAMSSVWTDDHYGGTAERPIKQGIGKGGALVDIKDVVDFDSFEAAHKALQAALKPHPIMANIIRRDKTVPFTIKWY